MNVVITICSANRREMLRKCVFSLNSQSVSEPWNVSVVLIDNSRNDPYDQNYILSLKEGSKFPLHYFYEKEVGTPFARNKSIDEALKLGADWIIIIDDDETAKDGWLSNLLGATGKYDADVIQGAVEYHFPNDSSQWMVKINQKFVPSGTMQNTAATNNVILRASIVRDNGLRFNEDMRFCGGSDTEFFLRVGDCGAKIIRFNEAVMIEEVAGERTSLRYQLYLGMRVGANASYISILREGYLKALAKYGYKSLKRALMGLLKLSLSPFIIIIYYRDKKYKRILYKSLRQIFSSYGILIGLTPYKMSPYKKIHGY